MVRKPTGEVFAQLRAERDNPKSDVWYGGTFDSFLQGAAEGLFAPYRSPRLSELHPWAQRQASATADRAVAIYRIVLGFGTNSALLAKKRLPAPRCWSDLVKPEYRNEVELSNPVTSGTGYTILATLVALYGEDGAFDYLKRLRPNVVRYTQSGTAQGPSVARGEVGSASASSTNSSPSSWRAFRSTSRSPARARATRWAAWPSSPTGPIPRRPACSTTGR